VAEAIPERNRMIDGIEYDCGQQAVVRQWTVYLKQGRIIRAIGFGRTKRDAIQDACRLLHLSRK
jgi:hypothetical protein